MERRSHSFQVGGAHAHWDSSVHTGGRLQGTLCHAMSSLLTALPRVDRSEKTGLSKQRRLQRCSMFLNNEKKKQPPRGWTHAN